MYYTLSFSFHIDQTRYVCSQRVDLHFIKCYFRKSALLDTGLSAVCRTGDITHTPASGRKSILNYILNLATHVTTKIIVVKLYDDLEYYCCACNARCKGRKFWFLFPSTMYIRVFKHLSGAEPEPKPEQSGAFSLYEHIFFVLGRS